MLEKTMITVYQTLRIPMKMSYNKEYVRHEGRNMLGESFSAQKSNAIRERRFRRYVSLVCVLIQKAANPFRLSGLMVGTATLADVGLFAFVAFSIFSLFSLVPSPVKLKTKITM